MSTPIEDYAIIGDTRTVAAVARNGSIDWWCVPRIDSGAVFAALLGEPEHGRWTIAPSGEATTTRRAYAGDSLILETTFETPGGVAKLIDFMSPGLEHPTIFRIVEGVSGEVTMHLELIARFDYGSIAPWAQCTGDGLTFVAGSDALRFHSPVPLHGETSRPRREFTVQEGQQRGFSLAWYSALDDPPLPLDAPAARRVTAEYWSEWIARCTYQGDWRDDVIRSLITVKALQYAPTGAVCAAATTSLPEQLGGVRNWDYRFSWLRDSSLTLQALVLSGYHEEASAWQHWLQRAVAGQPGRLPDHVRRRRGAAPHRGRARLAARLRGLEAGPHRQRGERAVPARRVRRDRRRWRSPRWKPGSPARSTSRCTTRAAASCSSR